MTSGAGQCPGPRGSARPARSRPSPGMWASSEHQAERRAGVLRACMQRQRSAAPPSDRRRAHPPTARASLRGCAGWWRCRRPPARAGPADLGSGGAGVTAGPLRRPRAAGTVKWKRAAPARLALHPDAPAHQLDQPVRDGQAQPGAAVLARRRAVGLLERARRSPAASRPGCRCRCRATGEVQVDVRPPSRDSTADLARPPRPAR